MTMRGEAMPYVDIKCYPRPEEMLSDITDKVNQLLMDAWGCPPETISISLEVVTPEEWDEKVVKPEMDVRADTMRILHGERK